mgnify:CR=1 FL=1
MKKDETIGDSGLTQEQIDKAMEEMECWQFQEHVKKCRDCQRIIAKMLIDKL